MADQVEVLMNQAALCDAINTRHVIRFYYSGDKAPGIRIVEPFMVAYNQRNNLALSAWFLGGESELQEGQGWREYLLEEISQIVVLPTLFSGNRPKYKRDGGQNFHNVQCAV